MPLLVRPACVCTLICRIPTAFHPSPRQGSSANVDFEDLSLPEAQRKSFLSIVTLCLSNIFKEVNGGIQNIPGDQKSHALQCEAMKFIEQFCDDKRNREGWNLF
jgi:hypothetical protein